MLAFLPPMSGPPRVPEQPPEPSRSVIGIALAVGLTLLGMTLPWLRHQGSMARHTAPPSAHQAPAPR